ncbi:MAG: UDP-N-acetylmuramoyl-L-alanyl-D-glutamate--2,6-diaminopimelate ligase [Propionibacteriaceae bacterium]|jgi:UDP-N-acetylmuramoyl-L-alanyl-D-glutamate--2,6-diaminopimelate ligase|nr:UDP-N-acetylmuramoyl-L-alanyl-D-glutamate--2,6-diaminopimelate ligase [Propionibacteriaceae bacterium]
MVQHSLSEYARALGPVVIEAAVGDDPTITQVTYDSREVGPGALFICKGQHFSPVYLAQAIQRGAVGYLSEVDRQVATLPRILVNDMRTAIAGAGTLFYDREWDQLTILGVTGTKGKSTTIFLLHSILAAWQEATGGPRPGIISSIRFDDGVAAAGSEKTTPETLELYRHLHNAVSAGMRYMCLEVSSQGLRYQRVGNITFEVGAFLNIAEDHISPIEHADMEDYLSAKLALFAQSRVAVVNARTDQYDRVMSSAAQCERVVTYALGGGSLSAEVVETSALGARFRVRSGDGSAADYTFQLPGEFNVENALAAIAIARELGVGDQWIRAGLAATRVPGRMEVFRLKRGTTVIVDYAHQKLSVTALLECVRRDYPQAPITMMFGSGGAKGLNRRQELGTIAGEVATEIYLTEDDPGEVPIEDICEDIDRYVRATGHKPAQIVPDRPQAIERAITEASDDGLVLLLGKGAETWQLRGIAPVTVPSDVEVVKAYIARVDQ